MLSLSLSLFLFYKIPISSYYLCFFPLINIVFYLSLLDQVNLAMMVHLF